MTKRGTCTECGRLMHVRDDGLIRLHRNRNDERCTGGHRPPQPAADGDRISAIPTRDELRTSILNRVGVFTTRVDWIAPSAEIGFADSVIALAEWMSDVTHGRIAA